MKCLDHRRFKASPSLIHALILVMDAQKDVFVEGQHILRIPLRASVQNELDFWHYLNCFNYLNESTPF